MTQRRSPNHTSKDDRLLFKHSELEPKSRKLAHHEIKEKKY